MNYEIFGGFPIPRKPNKKSVVDTRDRYDFWWNIEHTKPGLCHAKGCYIFAIRKRGGRIVPWYVGKTSQQGFYKECFASHKLVHYNQVLADGQGVPLLYLLARVTPAGKLTASAPASEIKFLESMLIGRALQRNKDLKNVTHASFLKKLHVPGLVNPVNPKKGTKSPALRDITAMLKA